MDNLLIYTGKVRNVYTLGDLYLVLEATDRVSSFDRHIGIIPNKGLLLNKMSTFWFNKTKHIIPNHLISTVENVALVHKCIPYKLEIVVRGYITGNTTTSLWTHYNNGERTYCGIEFPDNLKKDQKLPQPIITPTTKGKVDKPISREEIIEEGYMTEEEWEYISRKALELFNYGQKLAKNAGFILVDTKYEFGKTTQGQIVLIDEVHTCDSSRYWLANTYENRFNAGESPEKLDKDCIRDWIRTVMQDPYDITIPIPKIPEEIVKKAHDNYLYFYDTISSVNIERKDHIAVIIAGSTKDNAHVTKIKNALKNLNIPVVSFVRSAHKNTKEVMGIIERFDMDARKIIWITVAGRSNALSGVVAANSKYPVIACPPFKDKMDMTVNIHSTLQCPSNVPVMTILEPVNVALAVKKIFQL